MKTGEMTNEELANELDDVLINDELQTFEDVDRQAEALREAAKRLRNVTVRSDNSKVIAELQRRLKVAKDENAQLKARLEAVLTECANQRQKIAEVKDIDAPLAYDLGLQVDAILRAARGEGGAE